MKNSLKAFALSFALMLSGCTGTEVENEIKLPIYGADEISFEVATAQYMDLSESETIPATIGYPYAVYLKYPADALVIGVTSQRLANNAEVVEGDMLIELDSSALDYEINNQQTIVNAAYTASLAGGEAQRLQYEIEQSRLEMLTAEKEAYTIRAPFDGVLLNVNHVSEGATVTGGEVCWAVSEANKVMVYIDGNEANKFRVGQTVQVKIDGKPYDARVSEAPDVKPDSVQSSGRAIFTLDEGVMDKIREETPMAITAGWASVVRTVEKKNVLAVPDVSVKTIGDLSYVTIVDGDERYKLNVTIGDSIGGYTEIINGISEGDIVMADGSGVYSSKNDTAENNGGENWGGDWNFENMPEDGKRE